MDYQILEFGKINSLENIDCLNDKCISGCYFDWIKIRKLKIEENEKSNCIFNYPKISENRTKSSEQLHMQEMMLLVSNQEEVDLSQSKIVYVSLINIPMWNEYSFDGDVTDFRSQIEELINDEIKNFGNNIKIYNTFDHCDYVLVCDGINVGFREYIQIIKKLRNLTIKVGQNKVETNAIHDIVTIYGFNMVCDLCNLENIRNESVKLILSLNFKELKYAKEFKANLSNQKITPSTMDFEITGRYDRMMIWENIPLNQLIAILQMVINEHEKFFATKIHIGVDNDCEYSVNTCVEQTNSLLIEVAKKKFNSFNSDLKRILSFDENLFKIIEEIHVSICTMLKRGFAQYYILCFYESFYSFIEFIVDKLDIRKIEPDEHNVQKQICEQIFDMFRTYFSFLNALNASTLHSDRQFLQIDSYSIMYFDTPPKLIAFYTAMANKIASILNRDSKSKYTFLITPDFKKDIFVESLTNNREIGQENNILIIHMNEKSMYDVPNTLRIIAHEIAHHVGLSKELREKRAELYLKCVIAYMISHSILKEDICIENYEKRKIFKDNLVNNIFNNVFTQEWKESLTNKEEIFYYSESIFEPAINQLVKEVCDTKKAILFNAIKEIVADDFNYKEWANSEFWSMIGEEYTQKNDKSILKEFTINKIVDNYINSIKNWRCNNFDEDYYSEMLYLFRESYADLNMFAVTQGLCDKKIYDTYCKISKTSLESAETIDLERFAILFSVLNDEANGINVINKFLNMIKNDQINDSCEDSEKFETSYFYGYLFEAIKEYLGYAKNDLEQNSDFGGVVKDVINSLEEIEDTSFISIMNKEIYEYRLRLIK